MTIAGVVEQETGSLSSARPEAPKATLDPLKNVAGYVPESLVEPFMKNNVIAVVLLALPAAPPCDTCNADRRPKAMAPAFGSSSASSKASIQTLIQMLYWVVQAVPFAVFGVVAQVVGRSEHRRVSGVRQLPWRHPARPRDPTASSTTAGRVARGAEIAARYVGAERMRSSRAYPAIAASPPSR
jgi:hypothetical protein